MIDTHAHLNFKTFNENASQVIKRAKNSGVTALIVPGTNLDTSKRAVEIANKYDGVYAAVGIHPHHVKEYQMTNDKFQMCMEIIEKLLKEDRVVAVGEAGMDKHFYKKTVYQDNRITNEYLNLQKMFLEEQINLAIKHKKSLILHNREAADDILDVLNGHWSNSLSQRTVFHCCEPNLKLLDFSIKNKVYIGVDGDVTYKKEKQDFIKKIPLDLLVLETDSPFLVPEPLRSSPPPYEQKKIPNEPSNLPVILEFVAELKNVKKEELNKVTNNNAGILFNI